MIPNGARARKAMTVCCPRGAILVQCAPGLYLWAALKQNTGGSILIMWGRKNNSKKKYNCETD